MKKHTRCLVFILGTSDIQRVVACEHEDAILSCPHHAVIHILSAMYGRTDNITCRSEHSYIKATCEEQNYSLSIVKERCEGRQNCTIWASNHIFGNPCLGIHQYLDLSYQCIFKQGMYG